MSLSNYERETIINFNEGEPTARIYTHNKRWQRHLEQRLGLKPLRGDNDHGGREYELPKHRIPLPRAKRQYSEATKKKMRERLKKARGRQKTLF